MKHTRQFLAAAFVLSFLSWIGLGDVPNTKNTYERGIPPPIKPKAD